MIVNLESAIETFDCLPDSSKSYYYHPNYLKTDLINHPNLELKFFIIEEGSQIFYHGFYLGRVLNSNYFDIQSPNGYGGPLIIGSNSFKEKAIELYNNWCIENNIIVEFVKLHPIINLTNKYYGVSVYNRETVYMDLKCPDLWKSFKSRVRRAINKLKRENVQIIISKDIVYSERFAQTYTQLMKQKNTTDNYFFEENYYYELLKRDDVILINALDSDGRYLGGYIYFVQNEIIDFHLGASTELGRQLAVSNILIYEAAIYGQERGYNVLYLGGGNSTESSNSLLHFKKGFSDKIVSFEIGYKIHNVDIYEKLKLNFKNNRVLFYR